MEIPREDNSVQTIGSFARTLSLARSLRKDRAPGTLLVLKLPNNSDRLDDLFLPLPRGRSNPLALFGTHQPVNPISEMTENPFAKFDLERAIALRWSLRDILANRLKLSPVDDDHLRTLSDLGFVEIRDDSLFVAQAGLAALD
jgi:hypothetical protein